MSEVGSITFNANPMSATKVVPPRRWPRQPKTTPVEELKEALDAFPKTIVMDGCTKIVDEIDEAIKYVHDVKNEVLKSTSNPYPPNKKDILTTGGHPMFNELLITISKLHADKNSDYAGDNPLSNFRMCEEIGIPAWLGAWVRMSDKWNRIKSIIKKGESKVTSESLEDTLLDLATYSLLVIILLKETEIGTQIEEEES